MNLKTLKPAKKGEVRNPNGRPKGSKNRATIVKKWLKVRSKFINPETKEQAYGTIHDKIVLAIIGKALKGDVAAFNTIYDCVYGRLQEKVEIDNKDNKIEFIVIEPEINEKQ